MSDNTLPAGWTKGFSKSTKKWYYVHAATKHTQWEFPTASQVQQRIELTSNKKKRSNESAVDSSSRSISSSGVSASSKRPRTQGGVTATLMKGSSIAIIVPFRDIHKAQNRAAHLHKFMPHMKAFLSKLKAQGKCADYHIYIVEQSNDGRKFNRGKLLNIGFDLACKGTYQKEKSIRKPHDVFIFHDVDLLPADRLGSYYTQVPTTPIHIARVWDRYSNNDKYFGGIVSFTKQSMRQINGYPNTFWGWGGEDDEMQKRCEALGIQWTGPDTNDASLKNAITDLEAMNLKEKLDFLRGHKEWKCNVKWECLNEHKMTFKKNGLSDLKYEVLKTADLDGDRKEGVEYSSRATKVTVDVLLNGNHWANEKCGIDYTGY